MRAFSALYAELDATTSTEAKLAALTVYLQSAPADDAAWAVWFLAGGRLGAIVRTRELRALAQAEARLPEWLFEECYQAVGDLAETIALVLPADLRGVHPLPEAGLAEWVVDRLMPLASLAETERKGRLRALFQSLDETGRFLLVKLIGGGFRVGVSRGLVERALARVAGLDTRCITERMMGYMDRKKQPSAEAYRALMAAAGTIDGGAVGQPYPFFLAHPLEADGEDLFAVLGPRALWQVEWKFDGVRAQLVRRGAGVWIWTRGEELVNDAFPEIVSRARDLPSGTVLDGELLVGSAEDPAPFSALQRRLNRKRPSARMLAELPVRFIAYDLLEYGGVDLRGLTLAERRARLESLLAVHAALGVFAASPLITEPDWVRLAALRSTSRGRGVEGLMLKALSSRYGSGRTKGEGLWWKWKIAPMSVDAVLIYAQAGHGRRASLYTDYTFAVWSHAPAHAGEVASALATLERGEPPAPDALHLVPFAKAYSGLTDQAFRRVDALIRRHTLTRFGPVRAVRPFLVMEIGFEGIAESGRHKSGIAVRFPRMLRIRDDKPVAEADTLDSLRALLRSARRNE